MGHGCIITTERYFHTDLERLKVSIEKLNFHLKVGLSSDERV